MTSKTKVIRAVKYIIVMSGMMMLTGMGTRDVLPVVIALCWIIADRSIQKDNDKKVRAGILCLSIIFSAATTFMKTDYLAVEGSWAEIIVKNILLFLALVLMYNTFVSWIMRIREKGDYILNDKVEEDKIKKYVFRTFAIVFGALVLWTLLDYPGDISKDSIHVIGIARYDNNMLGAELPTSMVVLMRGCLGLSDALGLGANTAVFLYCTVQIFLISLAVTYLVYRLIRIGVGKKYCYCVVAYFAIVPFNVQFSHTVWKDIPFSYCCMVFMLMIWLQTLGEKRDRSLWLDYALVVISGIEITTLRSNGYYAFLFFIPFSVVLFWKNRKDMIAVIAFTWVLSMVVRGPISDVIINGNNKIVAEKAGLYVTNTEETEYVEESSVNKQYEVAGIYIVTCQQLAAVQMNIENLPAEEVNLLEEVFYVDRLKETYNPRISDNTLSSLKLHDTYRYLTIWLQIGVKHPRMYLRAWRDMTCGYWYPEVAERWIVIDEVPQNDYGVHKVLPAWFSGIRDRVERLYKRIPLYGLVWSIGACVWLTMICMVLTVLNRGWRYVLCYIPIIGVWLTLLIATPVYAEFRYLYSFFVCLPITLLIPWVDKRRID